MNNRTAPAVARSQTSVITLAAGARVSSDNPLAAFVALLAEDTKVGERTARLCVAHLQRFAGRLEQVTGLLPGRGCRP
jgi:hypothetical protein